jgi:hypothetical protein
MNFLTSKQITNAIGTNYHVINTKMVWRDSWYLIEAAIRHEWYNAHKDGKYLCVLLTPADFHTGKICRYRIKGDESFITVPELVLVEIPKGYVVLKDTHGLFADENTLEQKYQHTCMRIQHAAELAARRITGAAR